MKLNRIKEVLVEKGLTQRELAEKIGSSVVSVNSLACNRQQPSLSKLFFIADVLDVPASHLIVDRVNP